MEKQKTELFNNLIKEKLLNHLPKAGNFPTTILGLNLHRRNQTQKPENCFQEPIISLIIQGSKLSIIGEEKYHCKSQHCLIVGVDLPSLNYITQASPQEPFLSVSLKINTQLISKMATEIPLIKGPLEGSCHGVHLSKAEPEFIEAFGRLINVLEKPHQIPVLAPLIIQEIHYRILTSPQGECLCSIGTLGTKNNQISQAIKWIRTNFKEEFAVKNLAQQVNMGTSTFHHHFKLVTSFSPLQFQKQLRLYEAQRLMLNENRTTSEAAYNVGYESAAQFNREYRRLFGDSPHQNVSKLRQIDIGQNGF